MSTAAIIAGIMGLWMESATLVFLYSISEAAEGYASDGDRARQAIRALMELAPKTALAKRNGQESCVPIEELKVGDVFIVHPGEAIATDGEVISGHSSVNQAPITGESIPVEKSEGSKVFSASINGEGSLTVCASKTFTDNTLPRIIYLVENAQDKKGHSQRFIERCGKFYSPVILIAGILIAVLPPLFGLAWQEWVMRATLYRENDPGSQDAKPCSRKPHQALYDEPRQEILDLLHDERFVDVTPSFVQTEFIDAFSPRYFGL